MAAFARCQAVEIRDDRFDDDCADLVAFLGGGTPETSTGMSRRTMVAVGVAAAVVLLAGALYFYPNAPEPEAFSLTGDWVGQVQKPGQPAYRIRLRLAQTGKMLAGSVIYPTGEGPIVESRIEDDGTFTFATTHTPQFESEPATIRFQGQVVDGRLQLVSTDSGGMATGTASRAEAPGGRRTRFAAAVAGHVDASRCGGRRRQELERFRAAVHGAGGDRRGAVRCAARSPGGSTPNWSAPRT